jgi:hypothetical protein
MLQKIRHTIRRIKHNLNLDSYPEFCNQAPVIAKTKQERKKETSTGKVGKHGKVTDKTEDTIQDGTGSAEWIDKTNKVGKDDTRSAEYTDTDDMVLSLDKYLKLDETKYKVLKQVWAHNISAEKAEDDYRVKNLDGVGFTIRKLYWAAFNQAHAMNKQKRGEATV